MARSADSGVKAINVRGLGTPAATKAVVVLILSPQVSATS